MKNYRIGAADALRGFAVMGILLLHCIEHFNFYAYPEETCGFLRFTDGIVWDSLFFLFGGKAYAIFALLFGFSFFIQDNNRAAQGRDFRGRFAWRLFLLFLFGNLNAVFFTGEVLVLFSIVGFALLPVARLKTKTVLIIAGICLLQPLEIYKLSCALFDPAYTAPLELSGPYFDLSMEAQKGTSFLNMARSNLWNGQLASLLWAWENGRFFQSAGLFMLGMVVGREKLLTEPEKNRALWTKTCGAALLAFFIFNGLDALAQENVADPLVLQPLSLILSSLAKFGFMLLLAGSFLLLYYRTRFGARVLTKLEPYGKMSLSNYIGQSVMGAFIFYGWGLGMYRYLGVTYSFLAGIGLFALQYAFSRAWMARHRHGPLESVWKKLTWLGS